MVVADVASVDPVGKEVPHEGVIDGIDQQVVPRLVLIGLRAVGHVPLMVGLTAAIDRNNDSPVSVADVAYHFAR